MTRSIARATLARAAAAVTFLAGTTLGAQSPSHVYTLDGTLADALGGPSLVAVGSPTFTTEAGASGYRFDPAGEGFTLSGALASPSVYSIELRFLFDATSGYRKIVDFRDRAEDQGFYNLNTAAIYYGGSGGASGAFAAGTLADVVITRDASSTFTAYVNGTSWFSFTDGDPVATFTGPSNIIHFLYDDGVQSAEQSAGFVDYIRIYDQALTADQVAALTPPGVSSVPEPATVALLAGGLLAVGGVAARRRRTA